MVIKLLVRSHKGKAVVDLKGIPLDQMARLAEAITSELSPVREVRVAEVVSVSAPSKRLDEVMAELGATRPVLFDKKTKKRR